MSAINTDVPTRIHPNTATPCAKCIAGDRIMSAAPTATRSASSRKCAGKVCANAPKNRAVPAGRVKAPTPRSNKYVTAQQMMTYAR